MDKRCRSCHTKKGNLTCVLSSVLIEFPDTEIDCPCFECLVKPACMKQCDDRKRYFQNNIERIKEACGLEVNYKI